MGPPCWLRPLSPLSAQIVPLEKQLKLSGVPALASGVLGLIVHLHLQFCAIHDMKYVFKWQKELIEEKTLCSSRGLFL